MGSAKQLKVAFAIKSLQYSGGGAERVLVNVVNELASRGHSVSVWTFDPPGTPFYRLDRSIELINLDVCQPGVGMSAAASVSAMRKLRGLNTDADVVVGFMHSIYCLIAVAFLGRNVKLIASEHAGLEHFKSRRFQLALIKATRHKFVGRTSPTKEVEADFSETLGVPIEVISNPIESDRFLKLVPKRRARKGGMLLCVGRFSPEKGHQVLIKAFAIVLKSHPDWKLRLVGDGVLKGELNQLCADLEISQYVEFAGVTERVEEEYEKADLVVVPSYYEAFGLVIAEAMCSARTTIGFADCVGVSSLIEDGETGFLVQVDDKEDRSSAMSSVIHTAITKPSLCEALAVQARDTVSQYSISSVTTRWESYLKSVLMCL